MNATKKNNSNIKEKKTKKKMKKKLAMIKKLKSVTLSLMESQEEKAAEKNLSNLL